MKCAAMHSNVQTPNFDFTSQHLTCYTIPVEEMAFFNSSSANIHGGTFISAQGDVSINNSLTRDPEFGMHDFSLRSFRRVSLSMTV